MVRAGKSSCCKWSYALLKYGLEFITPCLMSYYFTVLLAWPQNCLKQARKSCILSRFPEEPDSCGSCHADAVAEFIGVAALKHMLAFIFCHPFPLLKDSSKQYFSNDLNSPIALLESDKQIKFGQTFCEQQAPPPAQYRRRPGHCGPPKTRVSLNQHTFLFKGLCMQQASRTKQNNKS